MVQTNLQASLKQNPDKVSDQGLKSPLLPMLFDGFLNEPEVAEQTHRLKILDVGPALPETVKFFGQFRCRLYFADLFEEQLLRTDILLNEEPDENTYATFRTYPRDEQFDICLFGDFLNFLDQKALQAFNLAIQPFIHRGTRAHAFGMQNKAKSLSNITYGIQDYDVLSERLRPDLALENYSHSLDDLKKLLPCFNIARSRLLIDGRLEILLTTHGV